MHSDTRFPSTDASEAFNDAEKAGVLCSDSPNPPQEKHFESMRARIGKPQTHLNKEFLYHYQNVGLQMDSEEWTQFVRYLHKDLPTTFRITSSTPFTEILKTAMKEIFCAASNQILQDESGEPISPSAQHTEVPRLVPLSWYPDELVWYIPLSRKALKCFESTRHLKYFLNVETEIGHLSRQEIVSMVSPLFLDVRPGQKILDMCAAPGSKTCQIIEMMHDPSCSYNSNGLLIANDNNISRCYVLAHQIGRLSSLDVAVTNYDAQNFPEMTFEMSPTKLKKLEFDRVLCDVPCSGDGTIRKNPSSGSMWDCRNAFKLHKTQLAIAKRAVELMRVGAVMVYSTCAFNPIENEAVIAQLLREGNGKLSLVDVSSLYPDLKRRPGLTTWKVVDSNKRIYETHDQVPQVSRQRIKESFFPPNQDEANQFRLERCLRFYPHLQDTGGFFLAVIHKADTVEFEKASETEPSEQPKPSLNRFAGRVFQEDPMYPIPETVCKKMIEDVTSYYGAELSDFLLKNKLLIRSSKPPASEPTIENINMIYVTNATLYKLLQVKDSIQERPRVVSAGLRLLENAKNRNHNLCSPYNWRIVSKSTLKLAPLASKRVVTLGWNDFCLLIRVVRPSFEQFSTPVSHQLATLAKGGSGACFIRFEPDETEFLDQTLPALQRAVRTTPQVVMGWIGEKTVSMAVGKLEMKSWKNLYTTTDYTFEFDKNKKVLTEEDRREKMDAGKLKRRKKEMDSEGKKNEPSPEVEEKNP
ncbi:RNA cytosine C(5)-methyltransferase NSUN2-like [Schistocerca gregaria]|uniref:RNA cytosine C(5)-methyltransferase NSUN2-like n=1 Tax=Schistocerca gregaria TaxID=7010 RepID=UPI00211F29FD|nr:RNA cytosine C(5)-methyltransferase NSUN2-like [Schistocerca gregaria]